MTRGGSVDQDRQNSCRKTMSGIRTLCQATQAGESSVCYQKISETTSPLTSSHLTPLITVPLDHYMQSAVEQETNKTQCNTKDEVKARILASFMNLNKEKGLQEIPKLSGSHS